MKNLKVITLAIAILGFSAASFAQAGPTVTESTTASANIITPLSMTKTADLVFGNIVASGTAGTVTIEATLAGTRGMTGGATSPAATTGNPASAKFNVTGANSATYAINIPTTVSLTGGTVPMSATLATSTGAGTLAADGKQTFYLGGTLAVGASQTAGAYSATFDVTVNYN